MGTTKQLAPAVPEALERMRAIVSDPRALPRRKEWISGQQYSYVLLENVEAMVDEACRAAMLTNREAQPVAAGKNCWSCGKFFTYAQHSECDGYCPHCDSPVDLDEDEGDN